MIYQNDQSKQLLAPMSSIPPSQASTNLMEPKYQSAMEYPKEEERFEGGSVFGSTAQIKVDQELAVPTNNSLEATLVDAQAMLLSQEANIEHLSKKTCIAQKNSPLESKFIPKTASEESLYSLEGTFDDPHIGDNMATPNNGILGSPVNVSVLRQYYQGYYMFLNTLSPEDRAQMPMNPPLPQNWIDCHSTILGKKAQHYPETLDHDLTLPEAEAVESLKKICLQQSRPAEMTFHTPDLPSEFDPAQSASNEIEMAYGKQLERQSIRPPSRKRMRETDITEDSHYSDGRGYHSGTGSFEATPHIHPNGQIAAGVHSPM